MLPETLTWSDSSQAERRAALARPTRQSLAGVRARVSEMIAAVRSRGDAAVREYALALDRVAPFEVPRGTWQAALDNLAPGVRSALETAIRNLEAFHLAPAPVSIETAPGIVCERRYQPLDCVGLYVPGGTAPLVSTVSMLAVPARVAGVPERILCTPPSQGGAVHPAILAAALLTGVHRVFAIGGAQAIAAMAFGTETVPKVEKLFGPGNAWVTEAKQLCAFEPDGADLDLPAGPSEVLVIADESADARFVAADLLSQAEHGTDSQAVLVATSAKLVEATRREVMEQLETLSRRDIAGACLANSRWIVAASVDDAVAISNAYAPEHLILHIENAEQWTGVIRAAGSVFVGPWSPESAGDYASGTNHVLPTDGWARRRGGLAVESFMRPITFQRLSPEGAKRLAPVVETLAELEGLDGHARAMALRREAAS